jgi:hypothetical protein
MTVLGPSLHWNVKEEKLVEMKKNIGSAEEWMGENAPIDNIYQDC